jgi:ubiquinone/menaquinone biosynthesis C-methylase UbiE
MTPSTAREHSDVGKPNADRRFYDDVATSAGGGAGAEELPERYARYIRRTKTSLQTHFRGRQGCVALELGAGSCALSLAVSDLPFLQRLICFDISSERMRALAPGAARALPAAQLEKIEFQAGDFNQPLPYEDVSLDVVLFDAALHHAASPWFTLAECRRVVKPDGLLIAQREQYLAYLTEGIAIARLLRSVEVTSGVIENSYYRSQYEYFLRARGFEPVFHGVPDAPWQRALFFLNGLIFSKWVIVARPIPGFAFTPASS